MKKILCIFFGAFFALQAVVGTILAFVYGDYLMFAMVAIYILLAIFLFKKSNYKDAMDNLQQTIRDSSRMGRNRK